MTRERKPFSTQELRIIWASGVLALLAWVSYSLAWWAHLEGDSPLYSLMSVRVLEGHHYIMTVGQAHGGTLLVYLRALLFKIFGTSHFLGFFVNGLAVTAGVVLWTRFAALLGGARGALVFALLASAATERFARAACTDYFAITLVTGGIMLNFAERLSREERLSYLHALLGGLLVGASWYLCRFSMLYLVGAVIFMLGLFPEYERRFFVPSWRELMRGKLNRVLTFANLALYLLSVVAFFASDQLWGINAESNFKTAVIVSAALWLKHRLRLVIVWLPRAAVFVGGALVGVLPELIFKLTVQHKDRVTGLVRWRDLEPLLPELPARVGINFSYYRPLGAGLVATGCFALLLGLGFLAPGRRKLWLHVGALAVPVGAWLCVHTYMHLAPQYFFPIFFPLYLLAAHVATLPKLKELALLLVAVPFVIGAADHVSNFQSPNIFLASKTIDTVNRFKQKYGLELGLGQLDSNYNLEWAAKGTLLIPHATDPDLRFPEHQEKARAAERIFYVHHRDDRQPYWEHPGYKELEHEKLDYGFEVAVLEKTKETAK